ncbi:sigma-70 family RNA polymerase sigma factor [Streptomyces syringium]|uniref:sigma-70 family RNA polymerase sigma factor n=1 Tax=Streptomyces syringium TaxID=76729 RepID=UPI003F558095
MGVDGRDDPLGDERAGALPARHVPSQRGPSAVGRSVPGPDAAGLDAAGPDTAAPDAVGSDVVGSDGRPGGRSSRGRSRGGPSHRAPSRGVPGLGGGRRGAAGREGTDRDADRRGASSDGVGAAGGSGGGFGELGASDGEGAAPLSDTELVARMRAGDSGAYEELYRRHADTIRRYARSCCRDDHTAEDLTNEVFTSTLQAVRGGAGPDTAVRAYLLTTVRRVAAAWGKTAKREQLVEDFAVFASSAVRASRVADDDTLDLGADVRAMREAEESMAVQAFRSLPARWQTVLWHTTVEEESPSQVAPLLGLTPNATAVLAHRAREGLKQAYLQAHVSTQLTSGGDCARYADRLGAYARGGLRLRAERGLRKHLEDCANCRTAALEVADVNEQLRTLLPVAVIGWFAAGYTVKAIAGLAVGAAGAGTAAGAGVATAASGGAAGSGAGGGAGGAAASEGLGVPAKIGIAAGAVAAAGAVVAYALTGSSPAPPEKPRAKASAPALPAPQPTPTPSPSPSSPPPPDPKPLAASPRPPAPTPTPSSTPPPSPSPSPEPKRPVPAPSPPPRPSPTPPPPPSPPAPLPPAVYQVNQLAYRGIGDGTKPEVRLLESGWLWQRYGLRIGGTTYRHGVSVHAASSVTIDLNRSCTSYDAMVGVDDMTLGLGAVRFSVYADGLRLWSSGVVRGGEAAVPVHAPLSGNRTIRLVVQPQSPADRVAVADWAQAGISCS